jgi:hypothetical protein
MENYCLINSIINNLSLFPIPSTVATRIDKHIISFFGSQEEGGKKLCNVKWASVVPPKKQKRWV